MSQPEVRATPGSWPTVSVGSLAAAEQGSLTDGPFGSNLKTSHYTPAGPQVIRLQNIGDGSFKEAPAHISQEHFERLGRHEARAGDVVIAMLGETLPRACLVPPTLGPAIVKADCVRLRVDPKRADQRFVMYGLNSELLRKQAAALMHGVGRPRLGLARFRALEFPLPSLEVQKQVVSALDSYFSRLDEVEAGLERVQRNLKRYRASVLQAAVTGRLVPTEAELARAEGREYEPASELLKRILVERRKKWEESGRRGKYVEPAAPDTSNLPELPEGWCWASIGSLFDVEVGATPSRSRADFWGGSIPWVSSGEVAFCRIRSTRESITEEGLNGTSTKVHPVGTVLIGMIGEGRTRGQVAILDIEACNNQNSAAIRVSEAGFPPEYVYYFLASQYEKNRRLGSGNNQPALNKTRVSAIPLALPPLEEQRRLAAEIEQQLGLLVQLETALAQSGMRVSRLRQSILRQAFEGKLADEDFIDYPGPGPSNAAGEGHSPSDPAAPGAERARRRARG